MSTRAPLCTIPTVMSNVHYWLQAQVYIGLESLMHELSTACTIRVMIMTIEILQAVTNALSQQFST